MTDYTPEALEALSKKATPGTWEVDSEYDNDALYSGGGGCGSGFKNYFIGADVGGKWKTLLDTVNSDHKLVGEEFDEDDKQAWDIIGQANAEFIVALVNAYRTSQLTHAVPSDYLTRAHAQIASGQSKENTELDSALIAQPSGDEVEAVARAICGASGDVWRTGEGMRSPFAAQADRVNNHWRFKATAAITALDAVRGKQ